MDEENLIDCSNPSGKSKGVEFLCRIARNMQEKDNNVSFSEIEDSMNNISVLNTQIQDIDDLKSILRPTLAKNDKAERAFNESFDKALKETFPSKTKVSEKAVAKKLAED